jgi:hypothetical protein
VPTTAPLRVRQLVDRHEPGLHHRLDDQLGDPVTAPETQRGRRVEVDQVDLDLPPVPGVDGPRRVDQAETEPVGQAGTRVDEAGVALGDGDGHARADQRALERRQVDVLGQGEIRARVAG